MGSKIALMGLIKMKITSPSRIVILTPLRISLPDSAMTAVRSLTSNKILPLPDGVEGDSASATAALIERFLLYLDSFAWQDSFFSKLFTEKLDARAEAPPFERLLLKQIEGELFLTVGSTMEAIFHNALRQLRNKFHQMLRSFWYFSAEIEKHSRNWSSVAS